MAPKDFGLVGREIDTLEAKVVNLLCLSAQCINRLNIDTSNFIPGSKPGKESRIGAEQYAACPKFKPFSYVPSFPRRVKNRHSASCHFDLFINQHSSY